jgi:pyruvyl transferase EpsO
VADLVESLRRTLLSTLAPLLRGARRVALLDFPEYHNAGDSAIWAGALRCLRELGLGRPVYVCDRNCYDRDALRHCLGDGIILLSGGGNFGDLWLAHQEFRERVVGDFPGTPIVQLPQTIHFESPARLERARAVLDAHPRLTLLVRDRRSLETARRVFRAPAVLCPDLAFGLGRLPRPVPPDRPVVWLSRLDREKAPGTVPASPEVRPVDWSKTPTAITVVNHFLSRRLRAAPRRHAALLGLYRSSCRRAARSRVARASALLSRGRVVVTDRLHGHILCLLLGIPHFLADNSYGKVRASHETWTAEADSVVWCAGEAEALDRALRAAAGASPAQAGGASPGR